MGRARDRWGIFIGSGLGDGQPEVSSSQMEGVCIWGLSACQGTGIQEELFIPAPYGAELLGLCSACIVLALLPPVPPALHKVLCFNNYLLLNNNNNKKYR